VPWPPHAGSEKGAFVAIRYVVPLKHHADFISTWQSVRGRRARAADKPQGLSLPGH
jgi:hypothetical protein